jgi:transposase
LNALNQETLYGVSDPKESLNMSKERKQSTEAEVREIRRRTRRKRSPEEKVRIVYEGLRGEQSVSELCRPEGIAANLYYRWSKDFLEAGKKQCAGDTVREATRGEVKELRSDNRKLKEVVVLPTVSSPQTDLDSGFGHL